jgi:hypothetical protein
MTCGWCRGRRRARSTRQGLGGLAAVMLAWACGGRSPLDVADGGPGAGFVPEAAAADDGGLDRMPSRGPPPDLAGLGLFDASSPCDHCEANPTGTTATATADASPAAPQTFPGGGGYSIQSGQCSNSLEFEEDGGSYQVLCSCPEGACTCFGPTTKVVPFAGCPSSCLTDIHAAISLCGW